MAFAKGSQKLGHPVPLSNLVEDENKGAAQPAQRKIPSRFSSLKTLEKGGSVPSSRSTLYASDDKRFLQSSLLKDHSAESAGEADKAFVERAKSPTTAVKKPIKNRRRLKSKKVPFITVTKLH